LPGAAKIGLALCFFFIWRSKSKAGLIFLLPVAIEIRVALCFFLIRYLAAALFYIMVFFYLAQYSSRTKTCPGVNHPCKENKLSEKSGRTLKGALFQGWSLKENSFDHYSEKDVGGGVA
jgi:hypothetical protein